MASVKYCPVCIRNDRSNKLVLYQINFRQAVYLCECETCTYPDGYKSVKIQERTLSQLSHEKKQQSIDKTDLDAWLENFFTEEDKLQNDETNDDGIINEDDLSKIIDEISKPPNENDVDLQYDSDLYTWIDSAFEKCSLSKNTLGNQISNEININTNPNIAIGNPLIVARPSDKNFTNLQCDIISDNSYMLEHQSTNDIKVADKAANNITCDILNNDADLPSKAICDILTRDSKQGITNSSDARNTMSDRIKSLVNDKNLLATQHRILNFEQFNIPVASINGSYKTEPSQTNMIESKHRNMLLPKPKKIISKGSTTFTMGGPNSTVTTRKSNKFQDFRFVNILIKPRTSQ